MFQIKDLLVKDIIHIKHLALNAPVISIEGQSGSGKSTFLRLLNNLDTPTSGTIYVNEEEITAIEPRDLRKRVVMVPQNPVIFDGTIKDNLLIGLKFSEEELASDDELKTMLSELRLKKSLDMRASDLSGGEKQRLALGRALLMKSAEAFLLDEPSSDLDDDTTNHILKVFINKAKEHNQHIIMITHDKNVSKTFADETISMDEYSLQIHQEVDEHGQ